MSDEFEAKLGELIEGSVDKHSTNPKKLKLSKETLRMLTTGVTAHLRKLAEKGAGEEMRAMDMWDPACSHNVSSC